MAVNETKIVLTAEDKTAAALTSAQRNLQQMEKSAMMAGAALSAIGVTFSAAAAVAFVKGTIDAADGLNDLSQRVGINIQQLAGWTLAANQSGTSMESVAKGVKGLSVYMVDHADKLKAAGITATDANGAMTQLADLFKAMPDGVEKTALAVQLFGKAGMDMIPMLNMGSKGLADAQEKAAAYGRKMAELAPDADKVNDQIEELALQSKAAGLNITGVFLPGLVGLSTWLNDVAAGGEKARGALRWMAEGTGSELLAALATVAPMEQGYKGPVDAYGLPAKKGAGMMLPGANSPDEAAALARARLLLDKGGDGKAPRAAKAAKRPFDPEGDFFYAVEESLRKKQRAQFDADEKEMEGLEKKRIAMEEMAEKRMEYNRISTEGEEAIRESLEKTGKAGKDMFAGLTDAVESWGNKAADTFADFVVDGKASFSDLANSILKDIVRIQAKSWLDPKTKDASGFLSSGIGKLFEGMFNPAGAPIASQGFGMAGDAGSLLGFAGGGFTGSGARSGGMDGQGGFLAMLHPQETVIDHAQGGSAGGAVTVILNISTGVAQTVRAEISNLLPSISASVQGAVMDARLRGGSTRAAYRG